MSNVQIINFRDFDVSKMGISKPESKVLSGSKDTTYTLLPLFYKDKGQRIPIFIEGPEMIASQGITSKFFGDKENFGITKWFDSSNKDEKQFEDLLNTIYDKVIELIGSKPVYKVKMGVKSLFDKTPPETWLNRLVFYPRDKETEEIIEDKQPSFIFKCVYRSGPKGFYKTVFTGVNGKELSWNLLKNKKIKFIPLLNIKAIFNGIKKCIQTEMKEAVILDISKMDTKFAQQTTINRLVEKDPELVSNFEKQLKLLEDSSESDSDSDEEDDEEKKLDVNEDEGNLSDVMNDF
jgi:hypothetical protein